MACAGYRLTAELGRGGTGVVFAAEQERTGLMVAIKVLLPELSKSRPAVSRFFHEARLAAGVPDPGVVVIYDHGFTRDGCAFLTMERLLGESLASRMAGPMPICDALFRHLAGEIARVVGLAHRQQIVHRDLKPDNIFLVPERCQPFDTRVKVLDFGMAKLHPDAGSASFVTETGVLIGTPLYMAPEQCRGGEIDARSDIYALGCILYELLCGKPPFVQGGAGMIVGAHLHEPVLPPRALVPALSEGIELLLLRALAKRPDDRQQTMRALADELTRVERLHV